MFGLFCIVCLFGLHLGSGLSGVQCLHFELVFVSRSVPANASSEGGSCGLGSS